jgi:hypothetical protein
MASIMCASATHGAEVPTVSDLGANYKCAVWIVWPGFIVAAVAELVFFSIFDPFDLHFFGAPLDWSRQAIYTLGFFGFWGLAAASSALTFVLTRAGRGDSRESVNGEPDGH